MKRITFITAALLAPIPAFACGSKTTGEIMGSVIPAILALSIFLVLVSSIAVIVLRLIQGKKAGAMHYAKISLLIIVILIVSFYLTNAFYDHVVQIVDYLIPPSPPSGEQTYTLC